MPDRTTDLAPDDYAGHIRALNRIVKELDRRIAELEKTGAKTRSIAEQASRHAGDSLAELQSTAGALVAHLARFEASRAAENVADAKQREELEATRKKAAAAHAARFDEQGKAIADLQARFTAEARKSVKTQWLVGAVLTFVILLGQQIIEGMRILHPTPTTQSTGAPR